MATALAPPPEQEEQTEVPTLQPLQFPQGYVPGKYASWDCSPEPIFGPDELGAYKGAIDDLSETCTRSDSAARIWEVMQATEARLFSRGYQFLVAGRRGWGMSGAFNGTNAGAAEIFQTQNTGKLFPCNVYSAREDKVCAILASNVPDLTFVPKDDRDPVDQTAADEKQKYLKTWIYEAGIRDVVGDMASLAYTDGRMVLKTGSVADQQSWGTERKEQSDVFDPPQDTGVTPETELESGNDSGEVPAVREVTTAYGKLEAKVPLMANNMRQMPWIRISEEYSVNELKERYPWIEDKIQAGSSIDGEDQLSKNARVIVRLAVQASTSSSESWQQDATETITWYRPSQYKAIKDAAMRKVFYQNFPDGLRVVHAGSQLAYVRNESMEKHLTVAHAKKGSGQNRRAIGSNYLPLQKVLNANISLADRYFRSAIARRFAAEGPLDTQAMNQQANDPAKITPVDLKSVPAGLGLQDITGVENVPQPNTALLEFIQWLIQGAPEVMDGIEPAMFGAATGEADQGVYQTAKLKRDAAKGIYSLPWAQIVFAIAKAAEQAASCAAENRVASIRSNVPGQGKLEVEISKLQGNALCQPVSLEIPQTVQEQEEAMQYLLANSKNVAIYNAIVNDPRNLPVFSKFPSLKGLDITGLDDVEQQQGEFELLMQSGPVDNPQLLQIQLLIQQAEISPEAQTPEGQQALMQLQQAAQSLPPKVSTVPVAQNTSENHAIHAAITLGLMNSPEGRKLKYGDAQQKAIYQNLELHWQEHMTVFNQLKPPPEVEMKASVTVDPTKLPPEAQAKAFQALGLQVSPQELQPVEQEHEVTEEQEGVNPETGVPTKRKISVVGKPLE